MRKTLLLAVLGVLILTPLLAAANTNGISAVTVNTQANGQTTYSLNLAILMVMTLLTVLPAILMTATSFTRIVIVLSVLRQAIGMPNIPTNQILIGLALFLTLFVMKPVFQQVNDTALQPYLQHKVSQEVAINKAIEPIKQFMLKQTRQDDLDMFLKLAKTKQLSSINEAPITVIMPAFLTSELKTAFQIGLLIYLPFLIIDLVVASVLMSMGMMMLSPLVISLPFKIMLFVMINGWDLVIGTLSSSFRL